MLRRERGPTFPFELSYVASSHSGPSLTISDPFVEQVLKGDREIGFQTPARVYGPDFVLPFTGVSREDLDA